MQLKLSLRDVETLTNGAVSNAYLSQIETGKIRRPSAHVVNVLAQALSVPMETLMEQYGTPGVEVPEEAAHSSLRSIHGLTVGEQAEVLRFLEFIRWRDSRGRG